MTDLIRREDAVASCRYDDAHDCRDAIEALPAVTVGVKPLVWHCDPDRPEESPAWTSSAIGNQYRIFKAWWGAQNKWAYVGEDGFHHTIEAAQAAAQADYTARILAALEPAAPDLSDPVTVHANMLRGTIAKPTVEQIVHLYGVDALAKALAPVIVKAAEIDNDEDR